MILEVLVIEGIATTDNPDGTLVEEMFTEVSLDSQEEINSYIDCLMAEEQEVYRQGELKWYTVLCVVDAHYDC